MVLDAQGKFVTQREHPRMALVDVALESSASPPGSPPVPPGEGDRLTLSARSGSGSLLTASVALPSLPSLADAIASGRSRKVLVWDDEVDAVDVGGDGAAFFSAYLGEACSLVYMPPDARRLVEAPHGRPDDRVGFADAYPVLVASLASLADLNARLEEKGVAAMPMNRFRPSIVVEGGAPYAEDDAATMQVGALRLRTPKKCARCQVTTVDQATAETSKEPLKTLASYRTESKKVMFAMNAIPELAPGAVATVAVGDPVTYATA